VRQQWVIANWKMNGDRQLVADLLSGYQNIQNAKANVGVCPPVVFLAQAQQQLTGSPVVLGAQNTSQYTSGAYTGEVSPVMLSEAGCQLVLVGHSERRALFGESNPIVAEKFCAILAAGMTPVLCVGETDAERMADATATVVVSQLDAVLERAGIQAFVQAIIAYEPVWAIGTGKTATPEQAQEVHQLIRQHLAQHDAEVAEGITLLYGGSVKAANAATLFAQPDIDGGLVGGASLDIEEFSAICRAAG